MSEKLQQILKYRFKNPQLLQQALTHSSCTSASGEDYERLEFLGDRVLGLSIAALLYRIFPDDPEGNLSQRFTNLVCRDTVAAMAKTLHLDEFMLVASEEIRDNDSILCDVCEAVLGAIFIDSGCERAVEFVNEHWKELIDKNVAPPKDAKTELQEVAHTMGHCAPQYVVDRREGSEHEPIFHVSVHLNKLPPANGIGRNKKIAEQEAAAKMLKHIRHE